MATDFSKYGKAVTSTPTASADFSKYGKVVSSPQVAPEMTADQASARQYGALFPAKTGEGAKSAGLKAIGNVIPSAFGLAKNLYTMARHPVDTAKGIGSAFVGAEQQALNKIFNQKVQTQDTQAFDTLVVGLKERYGSLENLQRTATNDPFGFGFDVLTLLQGGAGMAGKTSALNSRLSTTAQLFTKPVSKTVGATSNLINKTTKFGVGQATGLNPETISNLIKEPGSFTPEALKTTTRESLGGAVKESIDARLEALKETGTGYEAIRQGPSVVQIPTGTTEGVLGKYGIKIVDGKVKTTAETVPLSTADKAALEDFISVYGNEPALSSNAFLNTRAALSELSKYDAAKTGNLNRIARDLRGIYDELGKNQIPGLKRLDEAYAPEREILSQIKKDYLQPDGSFKDGAINKIANLTGVGKGQILERLEEIQPGIGQRIKILKAAEDIERAAGLKVGTYARSVITGGGILTGNIPMIVGAIVSSPEIAVRLLRGYGVTKGAVGPIIQSLYKIGNDVNNFRLPGSFQRWVR
jgi:hypothetical protein